jgi:glycosyltransferase involved in cell wall biosynthesis
MEVRRETVAEPFFSICIPQYNRTSFLIECCRSFSQQTFRSFEICISDGGSTDGRESELLRFLEGTNLSFHYRKPGLRLRYDGNLRAALDLARGRYCVLMGNDDALATPETLEKLFVAIRDAAPIAVAISNYRDAASGRLYRRIKKGGVLGAGLRAGVDHFRDFSFVSGVILETAAALKHRTERWDGSEMYQMYLGCRILAEGGSLLGVEEVMVLKDLQIPDEEVDSYASRARLSPCPIVERRLPLGEIGGLVSDAVNPYASAREKSRVGERILRQLLFFTYGFWIVEYRRVQSWNFAVGVCLGMRLKNVAHGVPLTWGGRVRLSVLYCAVTVAGLLVPLGLFQRLYPSLYRFAKSGSSSFRGWLAGRWRWREQSR